MSPPIEASVAGAPAKSGSGATWLPYAVSVASIAILVICMASVAFWQEKQRYRERAQVAAQNIAGLLDQHLAGVVDRLDFALLAGARFYLDHASGGRVDPTVVNAYLGRQESLLPEIEAFRMLDRNGYVRFGRNIPTAEPVSMADRDFYIRARDTADPGLIVFGPVFGRIAQKWLIVVGRRVNDPDGSFAGVIYVLLSTSSFDQVMSSIALGPHGAATIRTADLALVHRVPDTRNAIGSREVSRQLQDAIRTSPERGDYIAATALDGIERSNAYRRLQRHPFYVIVGLSTDDYLGGWKDHVMVVSGIAGLAILITCLAAVAVHRAHRRLTGDIETRIRVATELQQALEERARLNRELEMRAQDAEAANRAKSAFLANMSHELRTPMNAIMGMTGLALRRATDARQKDHLDKAAQAARNLLRIIDDILELTRIEGGEFELAGIAFRPGEVLAGLRAPAEERIGRKALDLAIDAPPEVADAAVVGDPVRLSQVLLNLLDNAIKFSESGLITVRARIVGETPQDLELRFEVEDPGIGVAPGDQARIFEAFEQADVSSTREYGGAGLGLTICSRLVSAMGGRIAVDSRAGAGSTFWFTVRLRRQTAPATPDAAGTLAAPAA